ncbi:MAG TPA: bifunctional nuclease family protein [Bacteroidales bacterium]|nr:bifunctional nuclease family protein [Bacteroidales bacterium]HOK75223.1 bifunctional nuclease family protein [Bacteroidales bacterium]HOU31671.1 bifunctional nuclease family protein [Bacteroidales bacterium]HPP93516.1 bifunctional nuclease family protein [Bacteroidales bacterium]HQK71112.1 bifunctional nuclease family protein [Bacteroidales bacterium]
MKRIKLKVLGISYSQTQSGAYALVLMEEKGQRRIPIIIGAFEAQSIVIKLENLEPPRPLTHDLFKNFADTFGIEITEVFIHKLEDGIFFSKLICYKDDEEYIIDSRTSDAVALALRFNCPIYTTEEIMEKAGITIPQSEGGTQDFTADKTIKETEASIFEGYTDEELYNMIDEAVKTEDYERAAAIRDELEKRKKRKSK